MKLNVLHVFVLSIVVSVIVTLVTFFVEPVFECDWCKGFPWGWWVHWIGEWGAHGWTFSVIGLVFDTIFWFFVTFTIIMLLVKYLKKRVRTWRLGLLVLQLFLIAAFAKASPSFLQVAKSFSFGAP